MSFKSLPKITNIYEQFFKFHYFVPYDFFCENMEKNSEAISSLLQLNE